MIQECEKQRIYRAGIGMYLAKVYFNLNDKGAAFRWALLTQADDLLGAHEHGGGAGRQMLHTMLGMSDKALAEFGHIATQNLDKINNQGNHSWAATYAFPEDILVKFILARTEYSQLHAMHTNTTEFPINKTYFKLLLNKVSAKSKTTKEQGDWLEDIATYLFLLIPGLVPRRNLLEETLAFETDIVIRNLNVSSNLTADLLGRHFLVECKNWSKPVGVRDIGYFLYRMRLTHAKFGVIFAQKGITGKGAEERAAYSLIRKAFHEDGNICIVIDNKSLMRLVNEELSFWSILLEQIERMRFGKEKSK